MAPLSDDTKWWIQISAVYVTLGIVAFRIWEKRNGRAQDSVSVNYKRWTSQRMGNMLNYGYNEWEMIKLEENAQHMRDAYKLVRKHGTHMCPWGQDCPVKQHDGKEKEFKDDAEGHIRYAYNMTKRKIDQQKEKRLKQQKDSKFIEAADKADGIDQSTDEQGFMTPADLKIIGALDHPATDETRLIIF